MSCHIVMLMKIGQFPIFFVIKGGHSICVPESEKSITEAAGKQENL